MIIEMSGSQQPYESTLLTLNDDTILVFSAYSFNKSYTGGNKGLRIAQWSDTIDTPRSYQFVYAEYDGSGNSMPLTYDFSLCSSSIEVFGVTLGVSYIIGSDSTVNYKYATQSFSNTITGVDSITSTADGTYTDSFIGGDYQTGVIRNESNDRKLFNTGIYGMILEVNWTPDINGGVFSGNHQGDFSFSKIVRP